MVATCEWERVIWQFNVLLRILTSKYHTCEIWVSYSGVVEDLGLLEHDFVIWVRVSKCFIELRCKCPKKIIWPLMITASHFFEMSGWGAVGYWDHRRLYWKVINRRNIVPQNVVWHGSASTDEICVPQLRWLIASLSWQRSGFDSRAVCHVGFLMEWCCRSNLAFPYQ